MKQPPVKLPDMKWHIGIRLRIQKISICSGLISLNAQLAFLSIWQRSKIKALENKVPRQHSPASKAKKQAKNPCNSFVTKMRSTPEQLEEKDLIMMLQKLYLWALKRNQKGDFKNAFRDNNAGSITDEVTGLIWEKAGSWHRRSRKKAYGYIDKLNGQRFAGRSKWRLPTIQELASLIEKQYTAAEWLYIDPVFGYPKGGWIDECWSADTLRPFIRGR